MSWKREKERGLKEFSIEVGCALLTFDQVTKSFAASPRLRMVGCSMTSSGISRLLASENQELKVSDLGNPKSS